MGNTVFFFFLKGLFSGGWGGSRFRENRTLPKLSVYEHLSVPPTGRAPCWNPVCNL